MNYQYEYPRAALTVDCVVFGLDDEDLKVLLIQRDLPPFSGRWALPGGFVRIDETLEEAARRELSEETGLENVYLEQLYTIGDIDRDPRERIGLARLADGVADVDRIDARHDHDIARTRLVDLDALDAARSEQLGDPKGVGRALFG